MDAVIAAAAERGQDPTEALDLVQTLRRAGVVVDAAARAAPAGPDRPGRRRRLAPDRAALSLRTVDPAGLLARRAQQTVVVHGHGRVAVPLGSLLAAAGIGRVHLATAGTCAPGEAAPGGAAGTDAGRPRGTVAAEALHRAAPEVDTRAPVPQRQLDLVVLATAAPDPALVESLQSRGVPHLVAGVREDRGLVGPLVLPARTGCLRCADLHRTDRDPAWPALAGQLSAPAVGIEPCETTLAAAVAAFAAAQALGYLDGAVPAAVEGTLELSLPDFRVRRRSWPPHPRCGCRPEQLRRAG
jgi:bacteriocin biosynthesis cyclodehydratase domain-containing protein